MFWQSYPTPIQSGKERPIDRRIVRFGQIHFPSDAKNITPWGTCPRCFKSQVMTSSLNPNTSLKTPENALFFPAKRTLPTHLACLQAWFPVILKVTRSAVG